MAKKIVKYKVGSLVYYAGEEHQVQKILDFNYLLLKHHKKGFFRASLSEISPEKPSAKKSPDNKKPEHDLDSVDPKMWAIAKQRMVVIKPIIDLKLPKTEVEKIAKKEKVGIATLYRWIKRFKSTGTLSSLLPNENNGGRGKGRLEEIQETIINSILHKEYLTTQKLNATKVYEKIQLECDNSKVTPPNYNTIRNRIAKLADYLVLSKRTDKKSTDALYKPIKGKFPGASHPLSVVQIDHTLLDVILVDEKDRQPLGRPWITVAIDVYSRMIPGYYISMDPPGAIGTGICIANSILPKDNWMATNEVTGDWPCWGLMDRIHLDNAKEFHGLMLNKASEEYGIEISWRPVATPHWGGHIERLIGTLLGEIHTLPGTTFSNPRERKHYDSEKKATMTLVELDKWMAEYIVNVYHKKLHKGIGTSPLQKYREGIFGSSSEVGIGLPSRIIDERKLRLDFLPFFERSILRYGVLIDHINYYGDILKQYINSTEHLQNKARTKRKFIFRRDPRDISVIYFWDPEHKEYFDIPYANGAHPPISIWDYNHALKQLKNHQIKHIDEQAIFTAHNRLQSLVHDSIKKTSKAKKNYLKGLNRKTLKQEIPAKTVENVTFSSPVINLKNIKPYDD